MKPIINFAYSDYFFGELLNWSLVVIVDDLNLKMEFRWRCYECFVPCGLSATLWTPSCGLWEVQLIRLRSRQADGLTGWRGNLWTWLGWWPYCLSWERAVHNYIMALLTVISATSAQPPNVHAQCVSWQKDFCYSRSSFSCLAIIYCAASWLPFLLHKLQRTFVATLPPTLLQQLRTTLSATESLLSIIKTKGDKN